MYVLTNAILQKLLLRVVRRIMVQQDLAQTVTVKLELVRLCNYRLLELLLGAYGLVILLYKLVHEIQVPQAF